MNHTNRQIMPPLKKRAVSQLRQRNGSPAVLCVLFSQKPQYWHLIN